MTRDALRSLAKLDKPVRRRIQAAIDKLQNDPRPAGMIPLRGAPGAYRLRDHRVMYTAGLKVLEVYGPPDPPTTPRQLTNRFALCPTLAAHMRGKP